MDWGRRWLVGFNTGKIQLVSFDRSKNTGAIDVKMDGSALEKKSSFKVLGLVEVPTLSLMLKLPRRKLEQ